MKHRCDLGEYDHVLFKSIGEGSSVNAFVHIPCPRRIMIGKYTKIDFGVVLNPAAEIGDYVHITYHASIIGRDGFFKIGHFATIAAGCRIICVSDDYKGYTLLGPTIPHEFKGLEVNRPVIIEEFASLATNVIVYPGVTIAQGTAVASGAIVTKDTRPWMMYMGVPAKPYTSRHKEHMIETAKKMGYTFEIKE